MLHHLVRVGDQADDRGERLEAVVLHVAVRGLERVREPAGGKQGVALLLVGRTVPGDDAGAGGRGGHGDHRRAGGETADRERASGRVAGHHLRVELVLRLAQPLRGQFAAVLLLEHVPGEPGGIQGLTGPVEQLERRVDERQDHPEHRVVPHGLLQGVRPLRPDLRAIRQRARAPGLAGERHRLAVRLGGVRHGRVLLRVVLAYEVRHILGLVMRVGDRQVLQVSERPLGHVLGGLELAVPDQHVQFVRDVHGDGVDSRDALRGGIGPEHGPQLSVGIDIRRHVRDRADRVHREPDDVAEHVRGGLGDRPLESHAVRRDGRVAPEGVREAVTTRRVEPHVRPLAYLRPQPQRVLAGVSELLGLMDPRADGLVAHQAIDPATGHQVLGGE